MSPVPILTRLLLGLGWGMLGLTAQWSNAQTNAPTNAPSADALPFDQEVINRYSLDHLPRSLSIRQNDDVWLGYDLERGKLYKAWHASDGVGLKAADPRSGVFVVRSQGEVWYQDTSEATWQLQRSGQTIPVKVRYLGCSHRENFIELSWQLQHDNGTIEMTQRVFTRVDLAEPDRIVRQIRVEPLGAEEHLLLPPAASKAWTLITDQNRVVSQISDSRWHQLSLR